MAEELDVAFEKVEMVLGTTTAAPDQGPTIASETIQVTAKPLRQAAATARLYLLSLAAHSFGEPIESLTVERGLISCGDKQISYRDLIAGTRRRIEVNADAPLKPVEAYRIVGQSLPRSDIARKTKGDWTYVHDVRVPGMLHGRVIRPPYTGYDHGEGVGQSLIAVDETSIADLEGILGVVVVGDFVGVVATREELAIKAAECLKIEWRKPIVRPDLNHPEEALRANPSWKRKLAEQGDVDGALASAAPKMERTYVWPYQMHGSIGPSCAVADYKADSLTVWSGTQNPYWMRRDLARLLDMPEHRIAVERYEASGCYGRNCADDVTADAALLSRAVGKPVRVQLTREQEHGWEPKGAAQVVDIRGGLDLEGGPAAYDFETRYPSNLAPTLALILTGKTPATPDVVEMGDRTAIPPYVFGNLRVAVHDMPPIARASWFRGVSAMPNSFAHESFIDELAAAAGVDPIEYRLRYLTDSRAVDLVRTVADKAKWKPRTGWGTQGGEGDLLYGRGFAYALYVHGKFPGTPAAWSAWVADVAVNKKTGEIAVTRVTVGQDSGLMINPDGVRHQIHGNVIQSISRVLKEKVEFSDTGVESAEWGGYPILTFDEVPDIDVLMLPRPDEEPRGVGESASVPSAAAIVNAVYDATGLRFRELPLTPDKILAGLQGIAFTDNRKALRKKRKRLLGLGFGATGLASLLAGALAVLSPLKSTIAPIARPDPALFSSAAVERGRLTAAAGGCETCHTENEARPFAGGRAFKTPFGSVYATNISPDTVFGIGAWSYQAFERAVRQGISRDGKYLYPADPYTSFINVQDDDIQDLYAYIMTRGAVAEPAPETNLPFPFNMRNLLAGWNGLFLRETEVSYDPARGEEWNRGAYLVEGLGHCSACHSERNVLGAEVRQAAHLKGGFVDNWHAPAISGGGKSPVRWSEDALYSYLRQGHSDQHGSASGPMAMVVASLGPLPDSDIRAIVHYLASNIPLATKEASEQQKVAAIEKAEQARAAAAIAFPTGARLFEGACISCHEESSPLASLALNSNLHTDTPNNLLQVVLQGTDAPAHFATHPLAATEIMSMPPFRQSFSDRQLAELANYMRNRFASDKERWPDVEKLAAEMRRAD